MSLLGHNTRRIRPGIRPCSTPAARLLLCTYLTMVLAFSALAAELEVPEARVKAAFLYNFTKLVTWPTNAFADSNSPIVIGILGKDTLGAELDQLRGLKSVGRTIEVARYESTDQATNCQVLFISSSERRLLDPIFDDLRNRPILTVGDTRGFASRGMIELVRADKNFELRINPRAAANAGLRLSSRLLRLDRNLKPEDVPSADATPTAGK